MNKPTHGSDTQDQFFRTQRTGDRNAELEITAIHEATGEGKAFVEKAIFAYRPSHPGCGPSARH